MGRCVITKIPGLRLERRSSRSHVISATRHDQICCNVSMSIPADPVIYAPAAMSKTCTKGNYPNATPRPTSYGSIIIVSSTSSVYGGMWGPACTVTQYYVLGQVKSSVVQLTGTGIRINVASSGKTDMAIELSDALTGLSRS
jgi:NAD(P)-dependent dehydrogenase (short-subunit alcohol dehydrogenase family)